MSQSTEMIVLNMHDGQPSQYLTEAGSGFELHWMLAGFVEPFEIWLEVSLSHEEAARVIDTCPPLDRFVQALTPRQAVLTVPEHLRLDVSIPASGLDDRWAISQVANVLDGRPAGQHSAAEYERVRELVAS